ncbi:conserved hypothetical protein [uncultured Gammaproteobacteria bacterium]
MTSVITQHYQAGLDSRRMDFTALPGTLTVCENAHITRGGEIEQRKAFVATYTLPANTFGLAVAAGNLYVFGSATAPTMPTGVTYQRLQNSTANMTRLIQAEIFSGKIYAIAEYDNGDIKHFYDSTAVSDWFDGRARASFSVTGGDTSSSQTAATATFQITGGTTGSGNKVSSVTVNGVEALGSDVAWATSNTATASAAASQINSYTSSPNYTATASNGVVTISHPVAGAAPNGYPIAITAAGTVTLDHASTTLAGGVDGNQITSIKVNGVEALGASVTWTTSNSATADAIASQINTFTSSPNYVATSFGDTVVVSYPSSGTTANGYTVSLTATGTLTINHTATTLAGGASSTTTFQPGGGAHTLKSKVYSTSGSLLYFSAINDPSHWTTAYTGAGFINLSNQASGSEELLALATYIGKLAVFSRSTVQIWIVDADQNQNTQVQVLSNTGTRAPRSVVSYGESDVFYLAESGVRSLKARDASNAAAVSDVGTMIDTLLQADIRSQTASTVDRACAVIEPLDGRYMLSMGSTIYVYSAFPASKISAWSTYAPGFQVTDWAYYGSRTYARAGNTIYLLGGSDGQQYDASAITVVLPYMDARKPRESKALRSINVACEGLWQIEANSDPKNPDVWERVAIVSGPTFTQDVTEVQGYSSHFKYRFKSLGTGYHRLGNFEWFYE